MSSIQFILIMLISVCTSTGIAYELDLNHAIDQLDSSISELADDTEQGYSSLEIAVTNLNELIEHEHIQSPSLYHALGNANMLRNEVGHAILAYRKAELLDPQSIFIRDSLEYARSTIQTQVPQSRTHKLWNFTLLWRGYLSRNWLLGSIVVLNAIGWICVSTMFMRVQNKAVFKIGTISLLVMIIPLSMLGSEWYHSLYMHEVVITQDQTDARTGPDDSVYEPAFKTPLDAGIEGYLIEEKDSWSRIKLSNNAECWVPSGSFELVAF